MTRPSRTTLAAACVGTLALAGCGVSDDSGGANSPTSATTGGAPSTGAPSSGASGASGSGQGAAGSATGNGQTVTLVTHDSWAMSKELTADFEKRTGYRLEVVKQGDAGKLANSLVLTKGAPVGDVTFGVDNTFATRVVDGGALETYRPTLPAGAAAYGLKGDAGAQLTPVDNGAVCVNVDDAWFAKHKVNPPKSLDDLTEPAYKDLFVTPGAATSSPGMAFLFATIAKYGEDGWQAYWRKLLANGTKVTSGWSDAWGVDYTAGGGNGTRPIVLSYNTSPADTVKDGKPTTSALTDTCFQQVEYAGVLKGAKNPAGAKALIDFLLGADFQRALPGAMYVLPVASGTPLPAEWKTAVKTPQQPLRVDPDRISKQRDTWLRQWQDVTGS